MKLILLIVLILTTSCAHYMGSDNEALPIYKITQIENPKENRFAGGGKIKIEYENYEQVKAERIKRNQNEMIAPKEAEARLAAIPKGGYIIVRIYRSTVETGNLKNFSYVLQKNDKEILRFEGGSMSRGVDTVPSTPSNYGIDGIFWTNIESIPVPEEFNKGDSIKLFAIDKFRAERDEFTIEFKPEPVK